MVTPWFAAGAGIVIAAALAVDSPSALTYAPHSPGIRCADRDCLGPAPDQAPDLATATPGVSIATGAAPGEGPATGPGTPGASAPAYQVGYQILCRWPSGFLAEITVPAGLKAGAWSLRFSFPSAHVDRVWGARWQPSGNGDSGTATGPWRGSGPAPGRGDGPGSGRLRGRQMWVSATGTPTSPSGCTLNGDGCHFG
jgi:Cellulose binding domain